MSPAKSKGVSKDRSNAETASNISAAISEASEKSQKRERGKKANKVESTVEKVTAEEEITKEENTPQNVEMTESKEVENGVVNKDTVNEEGELTNEISKKVLDDKMEIDAEETEKKGENNLEKGKNAKKTQAKKAKASKTNKKERVIPEEEEKIDQDVKGDDKGDDAEKEQDRVKPSGEDKMEVDNGEAEKNEVDGVVEDAADKNIKKAPTKKAANSRTNKKAVPKESKVSQKEDKEGHKAEDDAEVQPESKDMEAERPTRGTRRNKVEEAKKDDSEEVDKQTNSRQTRQKKVEDAKKTEAPEKKNAKSKKEEKKAEVPKNKRGAKAIEEVKEESPKAKKDDKKTSVSKKTSNAKNVGKEKEEKKVEAVKETAVANSRKRKADSDAKDAEKQANKKAKFHLDVPSEPMRFKVAGDVFSMGENDVGQLGLGTDVMDMSKPKKVTLGGDKVVQVSAGGMHSLCVTSNGEIYSFGCNDEATLGRVADEEDECAVPKKVVGIEGKVVQAIAGDSHSVALTEEGQVYIWGTFRDTNGVIGINPGEEEEEEMDNGKSSGKRKQDNGKEMGKSEKVEKPSKILQGIKVTKIAGGSAHILCLTDKGEVYSLGASDLGQLGRCGGWFSVRGGRLGLDSTLNAKPVRFNKRGLKCIDIWAGAYESFAKSSEGEILSWGLNNYHQLGFPDKETRMFPEVATTFDPALDWKEIACAEHHTIAMDGSGKVFCIGRKDYGRLGLGPLEGLDHVDKLTPIGSLEAKKCMSIGCGTSVSFAVADDGTIYGWGMGSTKQLGTGDDEEDILEPTPIKGKQLENMKGIMAVAGGQHTLLLASERS